MTCECTYGICCRPCWDKAREEDPCVNVMIIGNRLQPTCEMPRLHDGPCGPWSPGDPTRPIGTDNRSEVATLRAKVAELEMASVLRDKALESGDFAGCLSDGQRKELFEFVGEADGDGCYDCGDRGFDEARATHFQQCQVAHWLRVLGGPVEVQRQVDAAHSEALTIRTGVANELLKGNEILRRIYASSLSRSLGRGAKK